MHSLFSDPNTIQQNFDLYSAHPGIYFQDLNQQELENVGLALIQQIEQTRYELEINAPIDDRDYWQDDYNHESALFAELKPYLKTTRNLQLKTEFSKVDIDTVGKSAIEMQKSHQL